MIIRALNLQAVWWSLKQILKFDLIWFDLIWFDSIRFDLIWFDLIWFNSIWFEFKYRGSWQPEAETRRRIDLIFCRKHPWELYVVLFQESTWDACWTRGSDCWRSGAIYAAFIRSRNTTNQSINQSIDQIWQQIDQFSEY